MNVQNCTMSKNTCQTKTQIIYKMLKKKEEKLLKEMKMKAFLLLVRKNREKINK